MSNDLQIIIEKLRNREDYLSQDFLKIFLSTIIDTCYLLKYKLSSRNPSPGLYDIVFVDPEDVKFSLPSHELPQKTKPLGIAEGNWDLKKREIDQTSWIGLKERFEQGKDWEKTEYYKNGVERIKNDENLPVKRADNANTLEEFKKYLERIDELYYDIKNDGYRESSRIEVHVGRDGDWIVNSGYHRLILSQILDIDEIPAEIKYRHTK